MAASDSAETAEIRKADQVKKHRRCLGCGKAMWTDRCHLICQRCKRVRANTYSTEPPPNRLWGCTVHVGKRLLAAMCDGDLEEMVDAY